MKNRFVLLIILLSLPLASFSEETDAEYNELVDKVLELTGALKIGEQLSNLMAAEMTNSLKQVDSKLPDRAYDLIEEEVNNGVAEDMASGAFSRLMYPVYARYLTKADLRAMVAFYQTEAGKRIADATPAMAQEGMLVGQQWGRSLGPKIGSRVVKRLGKEGISLE